MKNIQSILVGVVDWVMVSSKDPSKISLTVKSIVTGAIIVLGYLGISGGEGIDTTKLGDSVGEVIVQLSVVLTGLSGLYGAIRKVVLTVKKTSGKPIDEVPSN